MLRPCETSTSTRRGLATAEGMPSTLGLVPLLRHLGPPPARSHTSGRTTSMGEDHQVQWGRIIKAGLVPRWRGGAVAEFEGRRPDEEVWHVVEMRPGRDPRRQLGEAVFAAAGALGRSAEDQGTYLKWAV